MSRRWFTSAPVVDGRPLLDAAGFWAARLADLSEGFTPEDFGADAADAGAVLERLHDPAAWPVLTVPLPGGLAIVVHGDNGEEWPSTHYFLTHADWGASLVLASDDQDRIGPGLCWPELLSLLRAPDGAEGVTDPDERLLLLLPVVGDADVPPEAVDRVVAALVAQGAPEGCVPLARRLLEGHPMWGVARWSFDAEEGSWLCDGEHSPRRVPLGDQLPADQRATLEWALSRPSAPGGAPCGVAAALERAIERMRG